MSARLADTASPASPAKLRMMAIAMDMMVLMRLLCPAGPVLHLPLLPPLTITHQSTKPSVVHLTFHSAVWANRSRSGHELVSGSGPIPSCKRAVTASTVPSGKLKSTLRLSVETLPLGRLNVAGANRLAAFQESKKMISLWFLRIRVRPVIKIGGRRELQSITPPSG